MSTLLSRLSCACNSAISSTVNLYIHKLFINSKDDWTTRAGAIQQSGRTYVSELERCLKQPKLQKIDGLVDLLNVHLLTPLVLAYVNQYDMRSCDLLLQLVREEIAVVIGSDRQSNHNAEKVVP